MGRVEYLLCQLTDSEAEQWSYLMRGDSGGCQAFQRLMLSLANYEFQINPWSEFRRLDEMNQRLVIRVLDNEYVNYTIYEKIGIEHLEAEGYRVEEYYEQFPKQRPQS